MLQSFAVAQDTDLKKLQGVWQSTSGSIDEATFDPYTDVTLTFKGDKFTYKPKGGGASTEKFKLDPAKSPKQLTTDGLSQFRYAIYAFDGDSLTFGFPLNHKGPRPKELKPAKGVMMLRLKKIKK